MSDITISWKFTSGSTPDTIYYLNGINVGINNIGFKKIIEQLRISKKIKVIIRMSGMATLNSGCLEAGLPFYERINEFNDALDEKELVYEFI